MIARSKKMYSPHYPGIVGIYALCASSLILWHILKLPVLKGRLPSASMHSFFSLSKFSSGEQWIYPTRLSFYKLKENSFRFIKCENVILTVKGCYRIINIWNMFNLTWNRGNTINWNHRETPFHTYQIGQKIMLIIGCRAKELNWYKNFREKFSTI